MKIKRKNKSEGFTLVEILLALGLASMLITLVFIVYNMAHSGYARQVAYSECQYSARMTASKIKEDVRGGAQVEVSNNNRWLTITTADGGSISYYRENNQVYRHDNAKVPVAENISSLEFNQKSSIIVARIEAAYGGETYSLELTCIPRINE